jgi:hypothetical protein
MGCNTAHGFGKDMEINTEKPHAHDVTLLAANATEIREYRLRFWDKGQANGDWSPVQK